MKDIELQAERAAFEAWFKEAVGVSFEGAKQRGAWDLGLIESAFKAGRAAVEDDRAQRVPDVEDLKDRLVAISSAVADSDDREAQAIIQTTLELLASTPAPAPTSPNRPCKEWYEKMIHETLDDDFVIGPAPAPAQQERKPMTDAQAVKCIEAAGFKTWTSAHFRLVRQAESHHEIKE